MRQKLWAVRRRTTLHAADASALGYTQPTPAHEAAVRRVASHRAGDFAALAMCGVAAAEQRGDNLLMYAGVATMVSWDAPVSTFHALQGGKSA